VNQNENKPEAKKPDNRKMHVMILTIIGAVLFIAGICIATIRGTHLRGSGLGTALIVLGVVLLVIAAIRAFYKRPA